MNQAGTLGTTHLLAYVSDGESAASVRALMHRQNIHDFAVEPGTVQEATEYLKSHASPKTLIVEVPSSDAAPRLLDALADVLHPATRVIVTGTVDTFSFYHWLMGLGIHDYLLSPFNESQLASALIKTAPGAATAVPAEAQPRMVVAVIGARGGVGATTIATGLAGIFASEHTLTTALVDMDVQFGSVALGLDLDPSRGLRDVLEKPDRIDGLFLERVMMKPMPNLSVLGAEEPIGELLLPHADAGALLVGALREKFAMTIIDLPRQMNPLTRYVLAQADQVLLVAEPSILSLRDTLRIRDLLVEQLRRPPPILVMNREGLAAKQEPSRADLARHLGMAPAFTLPYHAEMIGATARGENIVANAKLATIAQPLRQLAQPLSGKATTDAAKGSKIAKLLKGRK